MTQPSAHRLAAPRPARLPSRGAEHAAQASPLSEAARRVLHRTALSLASTPGGLRFVAGSRPWLAGLPGGRGRPGPSPCSSNESPA